MSTEEEEEDEPVSVAQSLLHNMQGLVGSDRSGSDLDDDSEEDMLRGSDATGTTDGHFGDAATTDQCGMDSQTDSDEATIGHPPASSGSQPGSPARRLQPSSQVQAMMQSLAPPRELFFEEENREEDLQEGNRTKR